MASADVLPGLPVGESLPPFRVRISPAANERYWRAAGLDHPRLAAGALYPPIAASLLVLTVQQRDPGPLLQTHQALQCLRIADTPAELSVAAVVADRRERRGRRYVVIDAEITAAGEPLWAAAATFTRPGPA